MLFVFFFSMQKESLLETRKEIKKKIDYDKEVIHEKFELLQSGRVDND